MSLESKTFQNFQISTLAIIPFHVRWLAFEEDTTSCSRAMMLARHELTLIAAHSGASQDVELRSGTPTRSHPASSASPPGRLPPHSGARAGALLITPKGNAASRRRLHAALCTI